MKGQMIPKSRVILLMPLAAGSAAGAAVWARMSRWESLGSVVERDRAGSERRRGVFWSPYLMKSA